MLVSPWLRDIGLISNVDYSIIDSCNYISAASIMYIIFI